MFSFFVKLLIWSPPASNYHRRSFLNSINLTSNFIQLLRHETIVFNVFPKKYHRALWMAPIKRRDYSPFADCTAFANEEIKAGMNPILIDLRQFSAPGTKTKYALLSWRHHTFQPGAHVKSSPAQIEGFAHVLLQPFPVWQTLSGIECIRSITYYMKKSNVLFCTVCRHGKCASPLCSWFFFTTFPLFSSRFFFSNRDWNITSRKRSTSTGIIICANFYNRYKFKWWWLILVVAANARASRWNLKLVAIPIPGTQLMGKWMVLEQYKKYLAWPAETQ